MNKYPQSNLGSRQLIRSFSTAPSLPSKSADVDIHSPAMGA